MHDVEHIAKPSPALVNHILDHSLTLTAVGGNQVSGKFHTHFTILFQSIFLMYFEQFWCIFDQLFVEYIRIKTQMS